MFGEKVGGGLDGDCEDICNLRETRPGQAYAELGEEALHRGHARALAGGHKLFDAHLAWRAIDPYTTRSAHKSRNVCMGHRCKKIKPNGGISHG